MLLVSLSLVFRKKRERDEDEEERGIWASAETKEYLTVTAKNRRSLGKVRREREKKHQRLLKIRSKSSALFISFRLGAEKTSEHDTCEFCTKSALLFTTFVPSPFTYSEKHLKEEGITDF